jgi:membrane dipeptidase
MSLHGRQTFAAAEIGLHFFAMPSDSAAALHARLFTIDTHSDTPTAGFLQPDWDFAARHARADDGSQIDLPRMHGAADAMVFAVYVSQAARTPEGHALAHQIALKAFDRAHAVLQANAAQCGLALSADDGPRLKAAGRKAIYLSIENAYSLGREVANVEKFHRLGVRMLGLTHMLNNEVADSSTDPRGAEWKGLSPLGREMMAECNRLGIVLDASHASDDVLRDLLEHSATPPILSHSDCRAVCDHPRNVGDDLLRALAAKGGVLQINALPISLVDAPGNRRTAAIAEVLMRYRDTPLTPEAIAAADRDYEVVTKQNPNPPTTLEDFIRHVEHAVEVMGIDHVGIGCDFDGGGGVKGMDDVSEFPALTAALLARGWKEPDLAKLWGENTLRVYARCERYSDRARPRH